MAITADKRCEDGSGKQVGGGLCAAIRAAIPAHFAVLDPTGRIIEANEHWQRADLPGRGLSDRPRPGGNYLDHCDRVTGRTARAAQQVAAAIRATLAGAATDESIVYPCRARDGERWFEVLIRPIGRADGSVLVVHTEVTRHVAGRGDLEASLSHSRLLALVAEYTNNGVIITDRMARIEWVNRSFVKRTGYRLEEVRGHRPGRFLYGPMTDQSTVSRMLAGVVVGTGFDAELCKYTRDGRPFWVQIECRPIVDAYGVVEGFISIETDVTERRDAERRIAEARDRLQLAVEASQAGLWDWDLTQNTITTNALFFEMIGHPVRQGPVAAEVLWDLVHPDDRPRSEAALRRALRDRDARYDIEFRVRCGDGSDRWVRSIGRVVERDATGRSCRMVGQVTDVDRLRRHVAQLEDASRARAELLANLSDEIRAPLVDLLDCAATVWATLPPEAQVERAAQIERIERNRARLLDLLDAIVGLSRLTETVARPSLPEAVTLEPQP